MADAACSKPPGEVPASRRVSSWFAGFTVLLAIAIASCSDVWDGEIPSPTATEVAFDLNCGETQENPCTLPPVENTCGTDPDDDMCDEDEDDQGDGTGGDEGDDGNEDDTGNDDDDAGGDSGDPDESEDHEDDVNPELEVQCTPEVVERGGPTVSCTAMVSSGTIENLSWSFSGGVHTLSDLGSDNPLVGMMAVSGTITATATVDGTAIPPASASITVTPRNWSSKTYPVTIDNVGNGAPGDLQPLPPVPMDFADFGDFEGKANQAGDATAVIQPIPSGPNKGLAFLTDLPPANYWGEIRLNEVAFTPGPENDFLNAQSDCTVSELQHYFETQVKAHEGLNFEDMSHAAWFRDKLNQIVGNKHEKVVGEEGTGILQAISSARDEARSDAHAHAASLHGAQGGVAPLPNCDVVFPLH